ncbi:MAG: malate dehydrogenase (oxaloacetate-decarboxylating) [Halanaerobium sp. 4-GBenrich]|jgi:malate dehydrogenase (oxaloacetate-decarboxylating)|uniref:Malate dehydrogenase (Oxaloacetate-decarboxylating) n=1 Tax=Halanaerobium congolense TaxID=54121 RepID=A0A1G6HPL3_9FIRM|nr:malic enzyme-like NAD(P)-binding protein [Halanaerobium congolense]KXS50097.1 MAG: malate dehydrogenase (oxaloacetate-decarboxylating) [Halanaerobium sp. T82-1]ODS50158.1 MAG: malate dehydrogenase (oxaloacetate-decarboxylating) [Halanaerobium sp. 4-GBenrich]OEG63076.1 MAG: malate dehydrogenase [Halanaerobium sp. MDAL1]PUU90511.1 MAG: malate dehydrogenase (oxaloacetate-decarboxylating) [Halanaerobium sp.]PXV69939.1 malate dehydrogenase (oxaloacetate-decarboxylating) [Halanaerobium congolense
MDIYQKALKLHSENRGKIEVKSKVRVRNREELSLAYSPGVAEPCREIAKDRDKAYEYTARGNQVAVVSSGTAVLGLGDIGPEAALPVMEGKAVLFKEFANVDAFPLCVGSREVDEIVQFVKLLEPTFAGINLEDISAPKCFEIEKKLKEETNMAVFHDDQHGTAVVVLAAVINALKLVDKKLEEIKIIVNGAGAAATAVSKLLLDAGAKNLIINDKIGILNKNNLEQYDPLRQKLIERTNPQNLSGGLEEAVANADLFIGLSVGNILKAEMVKKMAAEPLVFAMANPTPEIKPELALEAGAAVIATGRSDYPNQINNVLAFPGIFRGALDLRAVEISEEMKIAAAEAIASLVGDKLDYEYIIPDSFDQRVVPAVAFAVAKSAVENNLAGLEISEQEIKEKIAKSLN